MYWSIAKYGRGKRSGPDGPFPLFQYHVFDSVVWSNLYIHHLTDFFYLNLRPFFNEFFQVVFEESILLRHYRPKQQQNEEVILGGNWW